MHSTMHQTPPTVTLPTSKPPRRGRSSFYVTVGCLSVIAGLLLGVGGFFGVRAVQGDGTSTTGGEQTTSSPAEPTVLDETPVGKDSAVPLGSTFPIESTPLGGEVDVTVAEVDWDADEEIQEANSFNEEPAAGNKYLLITVEGVYRGDGFESFKASSWTSVVYVAEDGTEHPRAFRVTPGHGELIAQQGVAEDGSFLDEFCIEVPADVEPGGHIVLHDFVGGIEGGSWVEAA